MDDQKKDILEEYIKIFGKQNRPNLYNPNDESYKAYRLDIINSPIEIYDKSKFPFEGITLDIENKPTGELKLESLFPQVDSLDVPVFYIKTDTLKAAGYYESKTKYFYILSNSKIALYTQDDLGVFISGRKRLLDKVCEEHDEYYLVIRDAKCRSARVAASYVYGHLTSSAAWKDKDGNGLNHYYPDDFKEVDLFENNDCDSNTVDLYYIKCPRCSAIGYYLSKDNKFVLKKGSVFNVKILTAILDTPAEIARLKYFAENCSIGDGGMTLQRDFTFSSPSSAASFCLGRKANGWLEWKNKEGISLKKEYDKI